MKTKFGFKFLMLMVLSPSLFAVPNFCEKNGDIYFFNRETQQMEMEKILDGEIVKQIHQKGIKFIFKGFVGKIASGILRIRNDKESDGIIDFIKNYNIKMEDFHPYPARIKNKGKGYVGYNDFFEFFIRPVKKSARPIVKKSNIMPAFADARYRGFNFITNRKVESGEAEDPREVIVKKNRFKAHLLLGGYERKVFDLRYKDQRVKAEKYQKIFANGPMLIARLAPVDYHRFHFPVKGRIEDVYRVKGDYFPVNKLYVDSDPGILFKNERVVTIIDSPIFGKLAYIEIGAVGVGKIVHTHPAHPVTKVPFDKGVPGLRNDFLPDVPRGSRLVNRGDEKGYFQFGASTIVLLGEYGRWEVAPDIASQTQRGCEVLLKLGQPAAKSTRFKKESKKIMRAKQFYR